MAKEEIPLKVAALVYSAYRALGVPVQVRNARVLCQAFTWRAGTRDGNVGSREKMSQGGNCSLLWTPYESHVQVVTFCLLATYGRLC